MRVSRTVLGEHCGEVPLCYSTLCEGKLVKYAFIKNNRATFRVSRMCEIMDVSTSTHYDWINRPESARSLEDGPRPRFMFMPSSA